MEDALQVCATASLQNERLIKTATPCAIPAFRNLFGKQRHSDQVWTLLFEFATWHALAELRRHIDTTVADLRSATARLGEQLRAFADKLSPKYVTKELKSEKERRLRARIRKGLDVENTSSGTSKDRSFKLDTFKLHAMGHYVASRRSGSLTPRITTAHRL